MKCYSGSYRTIPDYNPHPSRAFTYKTLEEAKEKYAEFVQECENFDQTPAPLWVYFGAPAGDESLYGYPEMYDRILEIANNGAITVKK